MQQVFTLTLSTVGMLLIFISIGYFLRRHHDLPDDAGKVLSLLTALIFSPAYSIGNLSQTFTVDVIGQKMKILGYGFVFCVVAFAVSILLSRLFAKERKERHSLIYAFAIPNYGYFGYPVIQAVFGAQVLSDVMVFLIPLSLATSSVGYYLFMDERKVPWRKVLLSPLVVSMLIGVSAGLSGLKIPPVLQNALTGLGNCMSPASMLLAGFMLGKFPLKKLLTGWKPYILSLVRLVLVPLIFGGILLLTGMKGVYFMMPLLVAGLPLGLNLVVFPESQGHERIASENAKLCFISYLMAVILLPVTFAVITYLV